MKRSLCHGVSVFAAIVATSGVLAGDNAPYVQSDCTNTVNVGYFASAKTKIEVDFQLTKLVKNKDTVFGHYGNDLTILLYAPLNDSLAGTFKFSAKDGGYAGIELSPSVAIDLARHTAVIDMPNRRVAMHAADGTLQGEATLTSSWTAGKTSNWPLILFGSSTDASGTARQCVFARIYGVRISETENGVERLVHDLVPCLKGENAGFYDNETGTFFGGHGSVGSLAVGGEGVMTVQEDGYIETPADNSSRHLSFNTGYFMKSNSWLEVDYQWLGTPKDLLFGAWDAGAKLSTGFWINADSFNFLFKPSGGYRTFSSGIAKDNYRHTAVIDARNASFRLLNRSGYVQYSGADATGDNPGNAVAAWPVVLFGAAEDAAGTGKQWSYARIFSAKFYEGDDPNPVKAFVPYVKDGTVGFLETVSGEFAATSGMSYGGALRGRADAYVESDGSTCLNLGYKANMRSRIEMDFASLGAYGRSLCGAWNDGDLRYTFWSSNIGNNDRKWTFIFHGKNSTGSQYFLPIDEDEDRHTVVMDMKNRRMSVVTDGVTNWTQVAAADTFDASDESLYPMGVFGNVDNAAGTHSSMLSKARVFSVRIYEDGDLKHEFLPCKDGDTVSLYDTVDKKCAARAGASQPWPGIGGKGVEGAERWLVEPQDMFVGVSKSVMLKALAAGAVSYRWTCNGEAVAGGADGELAVSWRESKTSDVYAVTPVYSIGGGEAVGTAVAAVTVEYAQRGLTIIVK